MNKFLLYMFLTLGTILQFHSQESNGVVALALPVRNSLKFNRYAINPTFSFVREQNKYLSFTNKRQWVQFNNAPESYLFSYSGRLSENIGTGLALFQQNIGVLTTFGGMVNFAYNANLGNESNLTFGMNIGAYQSGINQGRVILNTPDTSINNVPSSFLLTVNPGLNYGTGFLDFGVSINNLVVYNLNTSKIIEENPEQAIQGHFMYTGYMDSGGFFDESKFSMLLKSEFKKDETVLSGIAMLTVPKGIWGQVGYNTVFGASAGLGINVTKNIAIEYNYEQSIGSLSEFGSSHEITLAYRFNKKYNYRYGDNDEELSLFNSRTKKVKASSISAEEKARVAERRAAIEAERNARIAANKNTTTTKKAQVAENNIEEQQEETKQVLAKPNILEETKGEEDTVLQTEEQKKRSSTIAEEKILKEAKLKEEARLKLEVQQKVEEERKRLEAEKIKREELALVAKREAEQKRLDTIVKEKALEEAKIKEEARLKLEAQQKAEEERKRIKAEIKRKEELAAEKTILEEEKVKAEAEQRRIETEAANAKLAEEQKAKAQVEARIKEENVNITDNTQIARTEENNVSQTSKTKDNTSVPEAVIDNPESEDAESKSLKALAEASEKAKKAQRELLNDLSKKVAIKQQDLDDLKQENDLSEKGIYQVPKQFKSISAENAAIEKLKDEIEKVEKEQAIKMVELEALLIKRKKKYRRDREGINDFYKNALEQLKTEQLRIKQYKSSLMADLKRIKLATTFERNRRISRAAYDNQQDRYNKDKATLERIKKFTDESSSNFTEEDFDFGEEQTKNIQIINNVLNETSGYYIVIAVHNTIKQRDEFVTKVVAAGEKNVNFFYDVKTNKYFIYSKKFNQIREAKEALKQKGGKPYNGKMSLVKIEN